MGKLADIQSKKKRDALKQAPAAPKPPLEEPASSAALAKPEHSPMPAPAAGPAVMEVQPPAPEPVSVAPPSQPAPSAPASASPHLIDESVLMSLPDAALINFSHGRFNQLKLASPQDVLLAAIDNPDIAIIVKVAKARNLLGPLFAPEQAAPERASIAPASVHDGPLAFEATMASDVRAGLSEPPPHLPAPVSQPPPAPTRVSKAPPPPPKRKSLQPPPAPVRAEGVPLSEINAFIIEIRESGESTKARFDRAMAFIRTKVKEIVSEHGAAEFNKAEVTTKQKQQQADAGAAVSFTPLEGKILELFKLNELIAWLSKRMKAEGGVHEILEANGKNGNGAAPQPPQPAAAAQQVPPASAGPEAQKAAAAPVAAESEKPARASNPPASSQPKPGALRRFFGSYTTWSVAGIGVFSGALAYADGYKEMAIGAKKLAEIVSGRQIADIPTMWAVGVYSAVMASLFAVSLLVKRSIERRMAERAFKRAQRSDEDREKMGYVFKKLSEIVLNYAKTEDQKSQIRQAMRTDEKLFISMYELRKDAIFDDILEDARVPQKLRGIISQVMIPGLELELMQKRLTRFADLIYEPKRLAIFGKTYEEDPVFRIICGEVFRRNISDDYVDPSRARALFRAIENSKRENVGEPLLKALQQDYDDTIRKNSAKK